MADSQFNAPIENSEHYTGFGIDVVDRKDTQTFYLNNQHESAAWKWVEANCSKYGFEISFPKDNKQGIGYEPWHLRYIGSEVPKDLLILFAYAKSGGVVDKDTLDKICKDSPKTASIEHTQVNAESRVDLGLDRIVSTHGIDSLVVLSGEGIAISSKGQESVNVASGIKLHIAEALYDYIKKEGIALSTAIDCKAELIGEGEFDYKDKSLGIGHLLDRMLEISSNTATNMLVDYLGGVGEPINTRLSSLGYAATKFDRYFSIPGVKGSSPNRSSAYDLAKAMYRIINASKSSEDELIAVITGALSRGIEPKGMKGVKFNKTGYNSEVNNNVMVYENPKGLFIVSAINNTDSRDIDLVKITLATNEVTKIIEELEIEGIPL